jgi:uncharacterized protein YqeY
MLEEKINQDLKTALLGGNKLAVSTLRGLKSAILYAKIASNNREAALSDNDLIVLLQKEARKRQESADLYRQGGNEDRAKLELAEKLIIENYLPSQLSESEVTRFVDKAISELGSSDQTSLGKVISLVKQQLSGQADGALIARITKERLTK